MKKLKLLVFLSLNIAIMLFELLGTAKVFSEIGWTMLIYYTQLSNLLLLIASIINIYFLARAARHRKKMPRWTYELFYTATCATTVTMLTVIFVLSWMYGDLLYVMTAGSMLYTHTICPILAIIALIAFTPRGTLTKKSASRAVIFTLAYGLVAIALNVLKVWHGPYPFLFVYEQPIWASAAWLIGILGGAYGIAKLLSINKEKK